MLLRTILTIILLHNHNTGATEHTIPVNAAQATVQAKIDAANFGDRIIFSKGVYRINKKVTL